MLGPAAGCVPRGASATREARGTPAPQISCLTPALKCQPCPVPQSERHAAGFSLLVRASVVCCGKSLAEMVFLCVHAGDRFAISEMEVATPNCPGYVTWSGWVAASHVSLLRMPAHGTGRLSTCCDLLPTPDRVLQLMADVIRFIALEPRNPGRLLDRLPVWLWFCPGHTGWGPGA